MTLTVAVDVGGTFTDLVLADVGQGQVWTAKTPTTPEAADGVLAGIAKVLAQSGCDAGDIGALHYGSTSALNALLTRSGPTVGLITTAGFRQILHLARSQTPGPLVGWLNWVKPPPLVALDHTIEVEERVGADGAVQIALDESRARTAISALLETGVEAIAVSLLHSYANPAHEQRLEQLVEELSPGLHVSLSSDVLPEYREFERTITTVVNTFIAPAVASSLWGFEDRLSAEGIRCGINVVRSDGGLMTSHAATASPVATLASGPSGGVAGALAVAVAAGQSDVLTLDMGGTSTDVALCLDGKVSLSRESEIAGFPVRTPSVDVRSIGAGGGSIAYVPELVVGIRVGPQSAGADPGPASYGRGGTAATVTDANVLLGRLPEQARLGGEIELDREAASAAISDLALKLAMEPIDLAQAIVDIANEKMAGALRVMSVERGIDPRRLALVAFGGAGPLHGSAVAGLLGCEKVLIPPAPGVLSAYGFHTVGHRNTFSRSVIATIDSSSIDDLTATFDEVGTRAAEWLQQHGHSGTLRYSCDMRFVRQGYEIEVPVPEFDSTAAWGAAAIERFHADHERLYGFAPDASVEAVNLRALKRFRHGGSSPPSRSRCWRATGLAPGSPRARSTPPASGSKPVCTSAVCSGPATSWRGLPCSCRTTRPRSSRPSTRRGRSAGAR